MLSEAEISRIERFGEHRKYRRGERLFAAGERAPGIFAVLKGTLTMSLRKGLGRVVPVVRHGPGQFTGEIAQLSGGFALVGADADEDVEVLLIQSDRIRALIVADAELGERIVRADAASRRSDRIRSQRGCIDWRITISPYVERAANRPSPHAAACRDVHVFKR